MSALHDYRYDGKKMVCTKCGEVIERGGPTATTSNICPASILKPVLNFVRHDNLPEGEIFIGYDVGLSESITVFHNEPRREWRGGASDEV